MAAHDLPDLTTLVADPAYAVNVISVVSRIAGAPDTGAVVRLLQDAAWGLGADGAMFTSFVRDDATLASYRYLLACDPMWALHYAQNKSWLDDPWLRYALYNTEPVVAETSADGTDGVSLGLWAGGAVTKFGFASTLVVPAPTAAAQSRVGVLCLGSARPGFFSGLGCATLRYLARGLAMEAGDWLHRQIRQELIARTRITADELTLLRHEQQGHSSKAIAAALSLEPKTIDCRFHRLSLKLGTANRRAAVRLAEIYGLI